MEATKLFFSSIMAQRCLAEAESQSGAKLYQYWSKIYAIACLRMIAHSMLQIFCRIVLRENFLKQIVRSSS